MKDKEKITFLQESIQRLEKENSELKRQIEEYKGIIETLQDSADRSERRAEKVINAHKEAIDAANEIATNYRAAIRDAQNAQKQYEERMKLLLNGIRKQK